MYQADIQVSPIYQYQPKQPILLALVSVEKMQTTCTRKHNEPSQDSYLAATLTGVFS